MDTPVVQFTGPWDGQVVATSVHAGNAVRADLAAHMVLDDDTRLREEDPHTDRIAEQERCVDCHGNTRPEPRSAAECKVGPRHAITAHHGLRVDVVITLRARRVVLAVVVPRLVVSFAHGQGERSGPPAV